MKVKKLMCDKCRGEVHIVRSNDKHFDIFEKTKGKVLHAFDCPCKEKL